MGVGAGVQGRACVAQGEAAAGDYEKAVDTFNASLALDPSNSDTTSQRDRALAKLQMLKLKAEGEAALGLSSGDDED